jgi:hypothetical protein
MRCTPSLCTPRNCSSSSYCWTRARFGLAASHLHMSEPCASLTRSHFTGSTPLLPRLALRRTPWLRPRYGYRVSASRATAFHRYSFCACRRHAALQHRPLMPMGPLCSGRPTLAHIVSFRTSPRARSRDPLGVTHVRSCTVREPLQRRLARVPLTRQRYASRASRVHTRACAFLLAPRLFQCSACSRAAHLRSPRALAPRRSAARNLARTLAPRATLVASHNTRSLRFCARHASALPACICFAPGPATACFRAPRVCLRAAKSISARPAPAAPRLLPYCRPPSCALKPRATPGRARPAPRLHARTSAVAARPRLGRALPRAQLLPSPAQTPGACARPAWSRLLPRPAALGRALLWRQRRSGPLLPGPASARAGAACLDPAPAIQRQPVAAPVPNQWRRREGEGKTNG